jgi:alpha-amylase
MASKASELRNMAGGYGIDRIWFPPPSKSQSGPSSMGYDPHDYYDLGAYNQDGTVPTHFGTQADLKAAISAFKSQGIFVMADIVLNHRSGGLSEPNPNLALGTASPTNGPGSPLGDPGPPPDGSGKHDPAGGSGNGSNKGQSPSLGAGSGNTWTDFSNTASGMCQWHYNEFHPSTFEIADEGTFAGMPDICHATGNSPGHAYYDLIHWGQWLQSSDNAGFNGGWRFDYVKGYHPWMAHDFWANTGSLFSVAEYWDTNTNLLDGWVNSSGGGISVFDFPLYYTLQGICNDTSGGAWLPNVFNPSNSYAARNPLRAVTFAANHDTDGIANDKMLAYAFILTYQGYPDIFWRDYYDYGLAHGGGNGAGKGNGIAQLVWAREKLAGGSPTIKILKSDDGQLIIYQSYGSSADKPGYIVVINTNPSTWRGASVQTDDSFLKNQTLTAYAWSSTVAGQNYQPADQTSDASGVTQVYAPPRGYAVFSVKGF